MQLVVSLDPENEPGETMLDAYSSNRTHSVGVSANGHGLFQKEIIRPSIIAADSNARHRKGRSVSYTDDKISSVSLRVINFPGASSSTTLQAEDGEQLQLTEKLSLSSQHSKHSSSQHISLDVNVCVKLYLLSSNH